jgi:hypothetical protein
MEVPGPVTRVPTLEELERLTAVPERRVVYRGVDWSFYEQLVDSIPESTNIHVDFDGKIKGDWQMQNHRRTDWQSVLQVSKGGTEDRVRPV